MKRIRLLSLLLILALLTGVVSAAGTAEITVAGLHGVSAVCTVKVAGELLPFDDLIPGAWYYPELRGAVESGLLRGNSGKLLPGSTVTRAETAAIFQRFAAT